jgi:hypothetical protein
MLKHFDLASVTQKAYNKLMPFINHQDFTIERARCVSSAICLIVKWCIGIEMQLRSKFGSETPSKSIAETTPEKISP